MLFLILSSFWLSFDELKEGVFEQGNALGRVVQDFLSGETRLLQLFHSQVDLMVDSLSFLGAEVLEGSFLSQGSLRKVLLVLSDLLLPRNLHHLDVVVQQRSEVIRLLRL